MKYIGNRREGYKPNDEFYTPESVFTAMGITFDLDVAAPCDGVSWIPTQNHYCRCDDGLNQEWQGRVWMNPPFSQSKVWVNKFREHGKGVALLPASKARWFQEIWASASHMVLLPYDLKFVYEHQTTNGIFMPCFLVAIGDEEAKAISKVGRLR